MLFLVHELAPDVGLRMLGEALRVAKRVLIVDSKAPLPRNPNGLAIRLVEGTFGREHFGHSMDFLRGRGIKVFL